MYRFLSTALLSLSLALPAWAARPNEGAFTVTEWGGIVDNRDTGRMDPRDAQDGANFLTDNDRLEVMPGMTELVTEVLANFPVRGMWPFTSGAGTKYLMFHASATVYYTNLSAAPVALENVSNSVETDAVQAFTRIYFNNRSDSGWYWDGTSTAAVAAMPLCKYLEFAHERIYCGNTSTNNSEVAVSSFGGAAYWTVPSDVSEIPDAPNSFTFQSNDGDVITCLKRTPWGIFIGKRRSTHILKGFDNETYYKREVSPTVGCSDDRLIQMVDGRLTWLSDDGVYQWAGSGKPDNISDDIENRISLIRQLTAQADSYNVTSQAEWENGSSNQSPLDGTWNTTIAPDSIVPATWTQTDTEGVDWASGTLTNVSTDPLSGFLVLASTWNSLVHDNFEDSNHTEKPVWTLASGASCEIASISGSLRMGDNAGSACDVVTSTVSLNRGQWRMSLYWQTNALVTITANLSCSDSATCLGGQSATSKRYSLEFNPISDGIIFRICDTDETTSGCSQNDQHSVTLDVSTVYNIDVHIGDDQTYEIFVNGVSAGSGKDETGIVFDDVGYVSFYMNDTLISKPWLDNVYLPKYSATGNVVSQIFDTTFSTPTWGPFTVGMSSDSLGILTFEVQASTANDGGGFETLTSQTPAEIIAAKQARYVRYKGSFATSLTTETARLSTTTLQAATTGIYSSAVQFVGEDITSWGTGHFTAVESPTGEVSYETRAATQSFAASDAWPSWTAFTNNTTVSHSTGSYFQFRITSLIDNATQQLEINRFVLNWSEGDAPAGASLVFDRRYFMCVTISTSSLINDSCEVYQRNNKWTRITGKSVASMAIYDNEPVAGDGSTGSEVWEIMRDGIENYAGDAIDAYWITKDFMGFPRGQQLSDPHSDKVLNEIWIDADYDAGKIMTIGYATNKSSVFTSTTTYLDSVSGYVNKRIPIDATYALGKYFKFKFSNGETLDNNFILNAYTVYGEDKSRTQD